MKRFRRNWTTGLWVVCIFALLSPALPARGQDSKYIAIEQMSARHNVNVSPDVYFSQLCSRIDHVFCGGE